VLILAESHISVIQEPITPLDDELVAQWERSPPSVMPMMFLAHVVATNNLGIVILVQGMDDHFLQVEVVANLRVVELNSSELNASRANQGVVEQNGVLRAFGDVQIISIISDSATKRGIVEQ
jgi:hypothetical protein